MNNSRRPWQSIGVAIILVALATALRLWPLQALGGGRIHWLTFYPAVMLVALYEGLIAGLLAVLLSCLAVSFLLPLLLHQSFIKDFPDWLGMAVFIFIGAMISGISEAMRRARARGKEAELECDRLFTLSLDLLSVASADGYFKRLNPAFTQTLGWSTEEMLARPLIDFVHPDDQQATLREIEKQVVAGENVVNFANRYRHKDGSYRWLSWKSVPQPGGLMYASARDITDLKHAEEELRQAKEEAIRQNARLQFIFDSVPVGIALNVIHPDGRITYVINDAHLRICGITREQAADGSGFKKISHPEDYQQQMALLDEVLQGKTTHFSLDKRYIMSDGRIVWAIFSFLRRKYDDGGCDDLTIVVDITERKQMEETLRQAQEEAARERDRFKFVFDNVPVGISLNMFEPDGGITYIINEAHLRICGITRQELSEEGIFQRITVPEDYARQVLLKSELTERKTGHFSLDKRYIMSDGRVVWVMFSLLRRRLDNGSFDDLTIVVDITERKQMENALRSSEENLAVTLHSIGDAVLTTDAGGRVTRLNSVAEKLTGWAQAEAMGRPIAEIFRIINEETRQPAAIPVDEVLATGEIHGLANHTVVVARDGTECPIADSAAPIRDKDGQILGVVLVCRDVTVERNAENAIRESARRLREHNEELEQRVRDRTAELVNANMDLTAEVGRRKQAEKLLGKLNVELEQRVMDRTRALEEANKELEAFSYSVSHDLRAPLRHIQGYVTLLEGQSADLLPEKSRRYLKTIGASGREMGDLIDDLLSFSRMSRSGMHEMPVRIDELVRESLQKLEMATQGRNIVWKIPALPDVMGDLPMLRQVFANLLGNAVKYTRTRNPAEIEVGSSGQEEDRIILFVRDNGVGFDMAYAEKLFGVFQRLHRADEFEGTGIGLANVRRIITRHGGRTWAEAELDKGATFYFTLKPSVSAQTVSSA